MISEGTPDEKPKTTTQVHSDKDGKSAPQAEVPMSATQKLTAKTTPKVSVKKIDAGKTTPAEDAKIKV